MSLWTLSIFFVLEGLLFIVLSIPLINRRIKPNPWYGFRTPKTRRSPDIWYPANVYMGKQLHKAGAIIAVAAIVMPALPGLSFTTYAIVEVVIIILVLFGALIKSFIYLSKL